MMDEAKRSNAAAVDKARAITICKIGQGNECCRYLVAATGGPNVLECAKHTPFRVFLDQKVSGGSMTAKGDNCDGLHP